MAKIYCKQCGYDLRGQAGDDLADGKSLRCPECGRPFDPADPKTVRPRPARDGAWVWLARAGWSLLALAFVLAAAWGWLYWGWRQEQTALAALDTQIVVVRPLGGSAGQRLSHMLGPPGQTLGEKTIDRYGPSGIWTD